MLIIVCRIIVCKRFMMFTMKEDILIKFGDSVRSLRLERNLSQEQLAEKADLHRTYIGMIERAEKNITLKNIGKIAKALDIKIQDFFHK